VPSPVSERLVPPDAVVRAQVVSVVDGDTIGVFIYNQEYGEHTSGQEFRVRYIGIDAPETKHPTIGEEPCGREAAEFNSQLVLGKTVYLEKDVSETDQYGRLLRYVWAGDTLVNASLVASGYAEVATCPPDIARAGYFLALERQARAQELGLWGLSGTIPDTSSKSCTQEPNPGPTPVSSISSKEATAVVKQWVIRYPNPSVLTFVLLQRRLNLNQSVTSRAAYNAVQRQWDVIISYGEYEYWFRYYESTGTVEYVRRD